MGLFLSCSLLNCSLFTLCALLNSNICLDGIQPVCCNCLYRTEPVVLVHNIHEAVSRRITIYFIFTSTPSITWNYFSAILWIHCWISSFGHAPAGLIHISTRSVFATKMASLFSSVTVALILMVTLLTCVSACVHLTGHMSLRIRIRTRVKQLCVDLF